MGFILKVVLIVLSVFVLVLAGSGAGFRVVSICLIFLRLKVVILAVVPARFLLRGRFAGRKVGG